MPQQGLVNHGPLIGSRPRVSLAVSGQLADCLKHGHKIYLRLSLEGFENRGEVEALLEPHDAVKQSRAWIRPFNKSSIYDFLDTATGPVHLCSSQCGGSSGVPKFSLHVVQSSASALLQRRGRLPKAKPAGQADAVGAREAHALGAVHAEVLAGWPPTLQTSKACPYSCPHLMICRLGLHSNQ